MTTLSMQSEPILSSTSPHHHAKYEYLINILILILGSLIKWPSLCLKNKDYNQSDKMNLTNSIR